MHRASIQQFKENFFKSEYFSEKFRQDIISTLTIGLTGLIALLFLGYKEFKILIVPIFIILVYSLAYFFESKGMRKISLSLGKNAALVVLYIAFVFPDVRMESLLLIAYAISSFIYNDSNSWFSPLFTLYMAGFLILQGYETYFYGTITPNQEYFVFNTIILFAGVVSIISTMLVFAQTYSYFIDQLMEKGQELKGVQDQYQELFDNSIEAGFVYDKTASTITEFNQVFKEMFRLKSDKPDPRLSLFNILDAQEEGKVYLQDQFLRYSNPSTPRQKAIRFEFTFRRFDGETFLGETTLIPLKMDTDKFVFLVKDISKEKEQQLLINQQVEDLNQKNTELQKYIHSNLQLENFAYIASHDLKAPMRTIISFSQLLKRSLGEKITLDEQEYLAFIISATKNLELLINDLLTFSRVNTTQRILEKVDVEKLLLGICQDLDSTIKEKKAAIQFKNLPEHITADRVKLRLLFQNFLTNSLKFVSENVPPLIHVSCKELDHYWNFEIEDNGIGIDEDFKEHIFLLFKRLHTQAEYEGTGIGLALCKKLVEQHEGEISLESKLGSGSCFSFTIKKDLA